MEGGTAFSVPLARKLETYAWLAQLARTHGLAFNTCRCKDLRLDATRDFSTSCRNAPFFIERGLPLPTCGESARQPAATTVGGMSQHVCGHDAVT